MRQHIFTVFLALLSFKGFAQTTFSSVAMPSGINFHCYVKEMGGGCAFFDLNNDGFEDVYLTSARERDGLFLNDGTGSFTNITVAAGLQSTENIGSMGVVTGDIDNDGDRDIFVTTKKEQHSYLFLNNGDSTFTDISFSSGIAVDSSWGYTASFGDYNKDGFLDIYVGNYLDTIGFMLDSNSVITGYQHQCGANTLWLNNGNLTFTNVANAVNADETGCNLSTVLTDYDHDQDMDIMNANDFGIWVSPNALLSNDYPNNTFVDNSITANFNAAIYGMGIAVGDYDHDADLDYYITNIGRNLLHQNNGNGTFSAVDSAAGVSNTFVIQDSTYTTGWGTGFMDIDNDGFQDLMVANGYIQVIDLFETALNDYDKLYYNNGDGTFSDISAAAGVEDPTVSRGFAYGDYDNDGDIDLLIAPVTNSLFFIRKSILYRNDLNNNNNWLQIKLQGTMSNRDGFGTHIYIHNGTETWVQEVNSGGSHGSQHSSIAHIGLGTSTNVDSLVFLWPSGLRQVLYNVSSGQKLTVVEGVTTAVNTLEKAAVQWTVFPNPTNNQLTVVLQTSLAEGNIQICNTLGQIVHQQTIAPNQTSIPLSIQALNLQAGIYHIHLQTTQGKSTRSFVVAP